MTAREPCDAHVQVFALRLLLGTLSGDADAVHRVLNDLLNDRISVIFSVIQCLASTAAFGLFQKFGTDLAILQITALLSRAIDESNQPKGPK